MIGRNVSLNINFGVLLLKKFPSLVFIVSFAVFVGFQNYLHQCVATDIVYNTYSDQICAYSILSVLELIQYYFKNTNLLLKKCNFTKINHRKFSFFSDILYIINENITKSVD
jgi:hypothetical protein